MNQTGFLGESDFPAPLKLRLEFIWCLDTSQVSKTELKDVQNSPFQACHYSCEREGMSTCRVNSNYSGHRGMVGCQMSGVHITSAVI